MILQAISDGSAKTLWCVMGAAIVLVWAIVIGNGK